MMLSKFRALPPKWAIDERVELQETEEKIERFIGYLIDAGFEGITWYRRLQLDLLTVQGKKRRLEKRIRQILIHGNINQRQRILEDIYQRKRKQGC